ncbi:MAG: hypothetical protein IAF38_05035, partial [Bacteroidia bacterium]|nr:hypothetical protein [Bacteroidia bacterium]
MAKKNDKKGKDKKASKPAAKKTAKPAAKNNGKKKPVKEKKAKPAKPAKKVVAKKPEPKKAKAAKPAPAKKEKEIKKPVVAAKSASVKKSHKDEGKKVKPSKDELEGEGLELEDGIENLELETEGGDDDEMLEEIEVPKPKAKGRKRKGRKGDDDDHVYDSENLIRKQALKIDLTKSLIRKPHGEQPKPFVNTKDNRTRYSDAELAEFKELLLDRLKEAETDYELLKSTLSNKDNHGTDDTSPTFKLLEDGSDVLSKEETAQLASR